MCVFLAVAICWLILLSLIRSSSSYYKVFVSVISIEMIKVAQQMKNFLWGSRYRMYTSIIFEWIAATALAISSWENGKYLAIFFMGPLLL